MATTEYYKGSDGGDSIVWYPNQPTRERDDKGWSYVWRGWCKTDKVEALVPDRGTDMSEAPTSATGSSGYECSKVTSQETGKPGMSDVEITYELPSGDAVEEGDIEQSIEPGDREVPIAAAYHTGGAIQDRAEEAEERDQKTVMVPILKYEYTEIVKDFEWTEANIVATTGIGPGEIGAPTGIDAPTANRWMFRGKSIRAQTADLTRMTEHWEYDPLGWVEEVAAP